MATEMWKKDNVDKLRAYRRAWYERNAAKAKKRVCDRRRELREWLNEVKSVLKCGMCPENHVGCLEFHHRDGSTKETTVSAAVHRGWGRERIMKEMEKCDILCANCHRKWHWDND